MFHSKIICDRITFLFKRAGYQFQLQSPCLEIMSLLERLKLKSKLIEDSSSNSEAFNDFYTEESDKKRPHGSTDNERNKLCKVNHVIDLYIDDEHDGLSPPCANVNAQTVAYATHQNVNLRTGPLLHESSELITTAIDATMPNLTVRLESFEDWEVILYIDNRERDHMLIKGKLSEYGIVCEVKTLALGDYLWIARPKSIQTSHTNSISKIGQCIVLDCIAERKTVADLSSSILDRRYNEQKMRLNDCGIHTCLYIVEGASLTPPQQTSSFITANSIRTAMVSTQIEDGLHIIRTRGLDHTITTLKATHNRVAKQFYHSKYGFNYMSFDTFQKLSSKKTVETIGDMYAYMMRQVPGCSSSGAIALQTRFGTMANMLEYMEKNDIQIVQKEISKLSKITTTNYTANTSVPLTDSQSQSSSHDMSSQDTTQISSQTTHNHTTTSSQQNKSNYPKIGPKLASILIKLCTTTD